MSKKRSKEKRRMPEASETSSGKQAPAGEGNPIGEFFASKGVRETIESVAIAFVLAFLFRTFEAEAFVIPTGSMAHTLMGEHKDVECEKCGYRHTAGASAGQTQMKGAVVGTICPMCQHHNRFLPGEFHPNYSGDRILVSKFIYDLQDPQRWDVVVFKFPYNAKQNYIKRLVGLPNETIRIKHGNLWTKELGSDDAFQIARKPPGKVLAMLQDVHDTDYIPEEQADKDLWQPRWQPSGEGDGQWHDEYDIVDEHGRHIARPTFTVPATEQDGNVRWLRYRHYAPRYFQPNYSIQRPDDWTLLNAGENPEPTAQLISDFYSYNASQHSRWNASEPVPGSPGLHWVGDLALEADIQVTSDQGKVYLDLVQAGRHYRGGIDVATGEAELTIVDLAGKQHPFGDDGKGPLAIVGQTRVNKPGKYKLMLANVDHQLTLWVNGRVVEFDKPPVYSTDVDTPDWNDEDDGDLAPAGVGSDGAGVEVTRLRVMRDIYYVAVEYLRNANGLQDYDSHLWNPGDVMMEPRAHRDGDPTQFADFFASRREVEFDLEEDQFFTLGDNSPESQDARIWGPNNFVDRKFMIGKAMFIYWPHATGPLYIPGINWPITPNIEKMKLVR